MVDLAGGLYLLGRSSALPGSAPNEASLTSTGKTTEPGPASRAAARDAAGPAPTLDAPEKAVAQHPRVSLLETADAGAASPIEDAPKGAPQKRPKATPRRTTPRPPTRPLSEPCVRLLKRATLGEAPTPTETNTL